MNATSYTLNELLVIFQGGTDDFICTDGPEIIQHLDHFVDQNWVDWMETVIVDELK